MPKAVRRLAFTEDDLRRGVRAQNAAGLERLARRIEPEVGWADLVLAASVRRAVAKVAREHDIAIPCWWTGGCAAAAVAAVG